MLLICLDQQRSTDCLNTEGLWRPGKARRISSFLQPAVLLSGLHLKRLKFFQNSVSYNVKFMAEWVIVGRKDFIHTVVLEVNEADRDRLLRFGGVHTSPRDANENAKTPFRKLSMPKMHFLDPVFSDGRSCRNYYYNFFSKERNEELTCLQQEILETYILQSVRAVLKECGRWLCFLQKWEISHLFLLLSLISDVLVAMSTTQENFYLQLKLRFSITYTGFFSVISCQYSVCSLWSAYLYINSQQLY